MGFLLRARLRFSHGALAVRIESCSPRHGILLGALHAVLLGPLELGFPTLEAALGLTLDPRSCLAQRVVELPAPPGPTLLGLAHGALALGLPARLTLVGFGGSALVHFGLGAAVFGFPARATLLGFAQRTRVRVALGALVLGQPAGTPFLGLARQSLVLGLPARPTLARLGGQTLRRRPLGALVLGVPARMSLVGGVGADLVGGLGLRPLERLQPFEPVAAVGVRRTVPVLRRAVPGRLDVIGDRNGRLVPARRPGRVFHTLRVLRPPDLRQRGALGQVPVSARKLRTRSTVVSGLSPAAWWPALPTVARRASGMSDAISSAPSFERRSPAAPRRASTGHSSVLASSPMPATSSRHPPTGALALRSRRANMCFHTHRPSGSSGRLRRRLSAFTWRRCGRYSATATAASSGDANDSCRVVKS